jgi:hypothetical protein
MLEKLGFKKLVEESLSIRRIPRVMTIYQYPARDGAGHLHWFLATEPSSLPSLLSLK